MVGTSYPHDLKESLCRRIHAGEKITHIEAETDIDDATLRKWYRRWLKGSEPSSAPAEGPVEDKRWAGSPPSADITPTTAAQSIVLAIPDMHHPFVHPDALEFLRAVKKQFNPNTYVCLGDECDFAAFSRYIPDPDGLSPGKELERAIESLIPFYLEFPEMLVCESNHTVRPLKKMFEAGLPAAFLPTYAKMLNAPDGWVWRQNWQIDGVRYHHGDSGRTGQFAPAAYLKAFKQSHCHGHLHGHASVMYEGPYFGVNAGCLIDPQAYAFKYARNHPIPVNLGCAIISNGSAAHFLPMHLDQHGKWIGSI